MDDGKHQLDVCLYGLSLEVFSSWLAVEGIGLHGHTTPLTYARRVRILLLKAILASQSVPPLTSPGRRFSF
jgi:uncharacterized membrane protein (DUF441 family)